MLTDPYWSKQKGESIHAFYAFVLYPDCEDENPPVKRSKQMVAARLSKSVILIKRWAKIWRWNGRIFPYEREKDREGPSSQGRKFLRFLDCFYDVYKRFGKERPTQEQMAVAWDLEDPSSLRKRIRQNSVPGLKLNHTMLTYFIKRVRLRPNKGSRPKLECNGFVDTTHAFRLSNDTLAIDLSPREGNIRFLCLTLLAVAVLHGQDVQGQSCGMPSEVMSANEVTDQIFAQRVKRGDLANPQSARLLNFVDAEDYGAKGDGIADDTNPLQQALNVSKKVRLRRNKIYRITRRLVLENGRQIRSDGTATLLMAKGVDGFTNTNPDRTGQGIYSEKGTGLVLKGEDIVVENFFLVKEYEDNRYVIAIELINAHRARLNRLRIRGFSLAPGIITISSSNNVVISNSIIHASCSEVGPPPGPKNSAFQITGIVVDDFVTGNEYSKFLDIRNNVITDLVMKHEPEQTDGITVAQGAAHTIRDNYINNVDEAIDTFADQLVIKNNKLGARGLAIKLIWGARNTEITDNEIMGRMRYAGIGLFQRGKPADQVKNIRIFNNVIDMRSGINTVPRISGQGDCNNLLELVPGICVESKQPYPPVAIRIERNRFLVRRCIQTAIDCEKNQCDTPNNDKYEENVFKCP
jgi:hypothetical protein